MRYWNDYGKLSGREREDFNLYKEFIEENENTDLNHTIPDAVGYEVLGPLLYGFSVFLHKKIEECGAQKIFFFSRDGWIIKKAYETIYPEEREKCNYLCVSRYAVTIPLIADTKNFDELFDVLLDHFYTMDLFRLGELCGIDEKTFDENIASMGYKRYSNITKIGEDDKKLLFDFIQKHKGRYFSEQKEYLVKYLQEKGVYGNVAVVDIGWNGSIQHSLQKYINPDETHLHGFYFGVKNTRPGNYYSRDDRCGYIFEGDRNQHYKQMFRFTADVLDVLFVNPMNGTVEAYEECLDRIRGIRGVSEYGAREKSIVKHIQSSGIRFVRDVIGRGRWLSNSPDVIMRAYQNFAIYPSKDTLKSFGGIYISDGPKVKRLIPDKSILYYASHPKQLKREINDCKCKLWFLAKLFGESSGIYFILNIASEIGMRSELQTVMNSKET